MRHAGDEGEGEGEGDARDTMCQQMYPMSSLYSSNART